MKIEATIKRETEKAVLAFVPLLGSIHGDDDGAGDDFWFPRSQIKILEGGIEVADWLPRRKLIDAGHNPNFLSMKPLN